MVNVASDIPDRMVRKHHIWSNVYSFFREWNCYFMKKLNRFMICNVGLLLTSNNKEPLKTIQSHGYSY